jgi:uncharacterized PurR-regulated membrane protein YhhQ (DUF165 family)
MIIAMRAKTIGWVCAALYVGTVYLANWMLVHVGTSPYPGAPGVIPVGFGLMAPAGVMAAGAALVLRDIVQYYLDRTVVVVAILVGALISLTTSPNFALASATAFLVAELVDMAVYTPLERRGLVKAVLASNAVGIFFDSAIFLWLAFGTLDFIWGQVVGKAEMTLLAAGLLVIIRPRLPEPQTA